MLRVDEAPSIYANDQKGTGTRRKSRTVDIASIEQLDRDDCIERWRQMFGVAPPKYTSLEFMRKALAYEAQIKAFGGHSNTVQRALKASLKTVQLEIEAEKSAGTNFDNLAHCDSATASYAEADGAFKKAAPTVHQTVQRNSNASDACDQISITGRGSTQSIGVTKFNGKADSNTDASTVTKSTPSLKSTKPSVLSIRAGTHLVREWNGRTYQVEALERGFRLDGKTYRSLSAIAKKITGAHWSGPRFFGLES